MNMPACRSKWKYLVPDSLDVDVVVLLLKVSGVDVSIHLVSVDVRDLSLVSIENLGDFLEGWAFSLNVEDSDEDEFEEDPDLGRISI
jgi:hypothetical protein